MKYALLFLCFIVLTLTVMPCCAFEKEETGSAEVTKDLHQQNKSEKDDCCKDCSPFYVCGSCTGFILTQSFKIDLSIPIQQTSENGFYFSPKLLQVYLSIWQPPQLF